MCENIIFQINYYGYPNEDSIWATPDHAVLYFIFISSKLYLLWFKMPFWWKFSVKICKNDRVFVKLRISKPIHNEIYLKIPYLRILYSENNIFTHHLQKVISLQDLKQLTSNFVSMVYLDDASTTMSDNQKRQLNNALSARVQTNGILLWYKV